MLSNRNGNSFGGGSRLEQQDHETYQGYTEDRAKETMTIPIVEMMQLEKQHRDGANWFYWIAGLSLLSSILIIVGSSFISALTLGTTQMLTIFGIMIPELAVVSGLVCFVILGIAVLLGYLSRKGHRWAYMIGIIFFVLDTLVLIFLFDSPDIIGTLFHCLILYYMIRGYIALDKLKKLVPDMKY